MLRSSMPAVCWEGLILQMFSSQSARREGLSAPLFLFSYLRSKTSGEPEEGYKVKVFSSLELAACWERAACKREALGRGWGRVACLMLWRHSWFEFLPTPVWCCLPHKPMERRICPEEPATWRTYLLLLRCFCGGAEFVHWRRDARVS